jgi:hypothetical protein
MTTTARNTPNGIKLGDGYQTLIAFAENPSVAFWEKNVKPPGLDGGDPVDTTTMHNQTYRTGAPRHLRTLTAAQSAVAYDPAVLEEINSLLNVNGWITIHYPDGSTYDFVGYLKQFEPAALQEGTQPEATVTIIPTNELDGVETDPIYTPGSGS